MGDQNIRGLCAHSPGQTHREKNFPKTLDRISGRAQYVPIPRNLRGGKGRMKRSPERTDFLACVLVTAVEGGINYWAAVSDYSFTDAPVGYTMTDASVTVHEMDDATGEYKEPGVHVTLAAIASAIQEIITRRDRGERPLDLADSYVSAIAGASAINDAGDIDADLADVIMQVAVLGNVVYG
jgi:hypothetical protein